MKTSPLTLSASATAFIPYDLYRNAENKARYRTMLQDVKAMSDGLDKPFVITEFGCTTFKGSSAQGGMGWDVLS